MRLRNRRAERQQPPQHGSTCGRVRRAHQAKSSDAALFFEVPGRHKPGMVVGFACNGEKKHGAHGALYRTRNSSCWFLIVPTLQRGNASGRSGVDGNRPQPLPSYHRGHGPLLPHARSILLIFQAIECRSVVIRRYRPHRCRATRARGIRVVPCTGTSTPRHGETTHSVAVGKRRYTSPCTFSKC